jgi:hypothetical protein
MAKANDVIEGLQILMKYAHKGEQEIAAEHDIIYGPGGPPEMINADDLKKLEELRWHYDATLPSWYKYV